MEIISHRGCWNEEADKNSLEAMVRSFNLGFGIETDVRDFCGSLCVSHDPIKNSEETYSIDDLFSEYTKKDLNHTSLALNVKADGISSQLSRSLQKFNIQNYFVFDMSIPETLRYLKLQIPFFSRQSEYELTPVLYEACSGIWIDAFDRIWYNEETLVGHISNNKKIAIVSEELHGRNHLPHWRYLNELSIDLKSKLILCTDLPVQAFKFFNS